MGLVNVRWVTIRKASLRNSSVGGGDLRNLGMRATGGCLDRKSLKRGVMSVMFGDRGEFQGYWLRCQWRLDGKLGCSVSRRRVIYSDCNWSRFVRLGMPEGALDYL